MVYKDKWYKIAETYAFPTKGSISLLLGDSSVIFYANSDFSSSVISLVNHSVVPEVTIEIRMQNEGAKRTVEFRFLSATFNEGLIAEISIITGANWIETVPTESVTTNVIALLGEVIGTGGSGAFDPNQFFYFDEEIGTVVSRYNIASEKGVSAYGIGTVGSGGGGYSPISVIDDLLQNTVDLTKALSARQGYILSGKIGEKQDIIPANTYSPFLHTHDNYAGKAAFEAHITNTDIHLSEPQKQALASFMEMFEMDVVNDSIKAKKTIYSVAGVSAYGLGVAGGGGGGADVYNGLDSDSPVMALSALQGKVLKGLIDTHNHSGVYATPSYVDQQISALVASSPETLNTLNELAAALGNDPNFATTITNQIGTKEPGLGNPASDGMILSSSAGGIRSWVNRYVLPIATAAILGGVMIGTGLSATAQGVLSHSDFSIESGIGGSLGHVKASEKAAWNNHIADNSAHMSVDERNFFNKLKTYFVFAADNSSVHTTINFFSQYGVSAYGLGVAGGGGSLVNVIDNLSSTSITEALSANMGRYLNTLISGKSDTGHSHTWESITGKPVTFAPAAHTHDLYALASSLSNYSLTSHNHNGTYAPASGSVNYIQTSPASQQNGYISINGYVYSRGVQISDMTTWGGVYGSGSIMYIADWDTGNKGLQINVATGAATFSSSVSATSFISGGNAVLHAGNYSSYALPLYGGTLTSSNALVLALNSTSASETYIALRRNGTTQGNIGYYDPFGTYMQGGSKILYVNNTASYFYNGSTSYELIHSGNIGSQSVTYAANSSKLYSIDSSYSYGSGAPYYGYLTYNGGTNRWRFKVSPATPDNVEVAYADNAGNSLTTSQTVFNALTLGVATGNGPNSNPYFDNLFSRTSYPNYAVQFGNSAQSDYATYLRFRVNARGVPDTLINALTLAPDYATFNSEVRATSFVSNGYAVWHTGNLTNTLSNGYLPYWNGSSLVNSTITSSGGDTRVGYFLDGFKNSLTISNQYQYEPELAFGLGDISNSYYWVGGKIVVSDNGNYNGKIEFKTCTAGRETPTTKMTILANGNIGIGTTTPVALGFTYPTLDIRGASGGGFRFGKTASANGVLYADEGGATFATTSSIPLIFSTNDIERLRILANGNVGIGYTDRNEKFAVFGNAYFYDYIETSSKFKIGLNYLQSNSSYLELQSVGNEICIGGSTEMYVNYRAASGGTPTTWRWMKSGGVYADFYLGYLRAYYGIYSDSYIESASYIKAATSIKIGANWEAIPNGTTLELKFNGITKARINSNGDLVAYGGLSAYGIPQV